ncbi:MAG: protein kinase [Myxococcales bacterium]|nr:protein kinase [Myxococcales bacterium]
MSDSPDQRICPICGTLTPEAFCPKEGASTVVARSFSKHPRNYGLDDHVADRYRITGALGSGGYAAVYSAEHTGTGQEVAVKLMAFDPTAAGGEVAVRRFFREARITAGLSHPNTVRVFDVGQDEGGALYIAMELLRGESLEQRLKRVLTAGDALSVDDSLDIMIPVLDSLAEAHDKQLVHRDLKPANIFLTQVTQEDETVMVPKVLDFGIARTADSSLTVGGTIPGTPPFMSPEQCRGEELDGRSDLYSLAVLLFLCVTGRLPFHDTNVLRLMRMHAFDAPPNPRSKTNRPLPDGLVSLLMRSLAKAPADRPPTAAAMRKELAEIQQGNWTPPVFDGDTAAAVDSVSASEQLTLDSAPSVLESGSDEGGSTPGSAPSVSSGGSAGDTAAGELTVAHKSASDPARASAQESANLAPSHDLKDGAAPENTAHASPSDGGSEATETKPGRIVMWLGLTLLLLAGATIAVLLARGNGRGDHPAQTSAQGANHQAGDHGEPRPAGSAVANGDAGRTQNAPDAAAGTAAAAPDASHQEVSRDSANAASAAVGTAPDAIADAAAHVAPSTAAAAAVAYARAKVATDRAAKLKYAREAARLAPTNADYAQLLKALSAPVRPKKADVKPSKIKPKTVGKAPKVKAKAPMVRPVTKKKGLGPALMED